MIRRRKRRVKIEVVPTVVERVECLSTQEFLTRYRDTAAKNLPNAYATHHPLHQSASTGAVSSTLCEDVFSLVECQINIMEEYLVKSNLRLTPEGDTVLVECLQCIIRNLTCKHMDFRDSFMGDLERSCASANDYYRMMESLEQILSSLRRTYPVLTPNQEGTFENSAASVLHQEATELLTLYSSDAVYAAQRAHRFVIREIHQSSISSQLFTREWESRFVNNELAVSLVKAMEEYVYEFHNYLCNDLLYRKAVDALVKAIVCFYVRCLVQRAEDSRRGKIRRDKPFVNPKRAVCRMMYDIQVIRTYFHHLVKTIPSLAKVVECELDVLVVIHECLGIAAGTNESSTLEEMVVVLHKRSGGNYDVTRHLMGDLWRLAAPPKRQHEIHNTVSLMQAELQVLSSQMEEQSQLTTLSQKTSRDPLQGLHLATALQQIYEDRILQERASICAPCVRVAAEIAARSNKPNEQQERLLSSKPEPKAKMNDFDKFLSSLQLRKPRLDK